MERVRLAVIGLGNIAQTVHLPLWAAAASEVELVAVCDRDEAKAKAIAKKFGVARYYTDPEQVYRLPEVEAVDLCTTTDYHRTGAIAAMEAGKHVLVEKPVARTAAEAARMVATSERTGRILMVAMNQRFRPDAMILKSFIDGGELGEVFYIKSGWTRRLVGEAAWLRQKRISGGGVFIDTGIVMLDLSLWLMGFPAVEAVSATHFSHGKAAVEDSSVTMIRLKDGRAINIEVSWTVPTEEDRLFLHAFGTSGSARLNPLRINKAMQGQLVNLTPQKTERSENLYKRSYETELRHFIGAVRGLNPVFSTAREALARMQVVEAVYLSAQERREVVLSDPAL